MNASGFLLRECGLTAEQVRGSRFVHRILSPPTNHLPGYEAGLERAREWKRKNKPGRIAEYHRRYAARRRAANLARGLTTQGKVRQHRGRVTQLEALEHRTTVDRIRMDERLARGLTTNGTPRKRRSKHCPDFQKPKARR